MPENIENTKDLLVTTLKRPLDPAARGNDAAVMRDLVGFLNNPEITGARVESLVAGVNAIEKKHSTPVAPPEAAKPSSKAIDGAKVFYTGRLKAGKDHVAGLTGAKIFGFSEPLYFLLKYFFGVEDKDKHGARKFLQQCGQLGRGVINEQYPVSIERANFVNLVREHAASGFGGRHSEIKDFKVNWDAFGYDDNIWLDAVIMRMEAFLADTPDARVATTSVRFEHEFKRMQEFGFRHYHVLTTSDEWALRLKKDGLDSKSPVVSDYSEKLAAAIDADVTRKISAQRTGSKLNVIWNSSKPPPSPRLYTVAEFLSAIGGGVAAPGSAPAIVI